MTPPHVFTPEQVVEIAYSAAGAATAVFARELDIPPELDDQAIAAVRDVLADYDAAVREVLADDDPAGPVQSWLAAVHRFAVTEEGEQIADDLLAGERDEAGTVDGDDAGGEARLMQHDRWSTNIEAAAHLARELELPPERDVPSRAELADAPPPRPRRPELEDEQKRT